MRDGYGSSRRVRSRKSWRRTRRRWQCQCWNLFCRCYNLLHHFLNALGSLLAGDGGQHTRSQKAREAALLPGLHELLVSFAEPESEPAGGVPPAKGKGGGPREAKSKRRKA